MSWVFIDSSEAGRYRLGLIGGGRVDVKTKTGRTTRLLPALASIVTHKKMQAIDGICVVAGPGSFSAIRSGVLIAHLLSRLLGKPLVGIQTPEAHDLSNLATRLDEGRCVSSSWVAPIYNAPPNITAPTAHV